MTLQLDKIKIHKMLEQLKQIDPQYKNFGSGAHRYQLNPPLNHSEIDLFESKHHLTLPIDYKYFITEIGNGGAGPYYGLFKFGEQDDGYDFCRWDQGYLVGDLSAEFSHEDAWNLPASFWDSRPDPGPDTPEEEEDRLLDEWYKKLEEHYYAQKIMNGAIPICHEGCAYRQWLVINGKQKGYVWADARVDDAGITPLREPNGKQVTFSIWYTSWLNRLFNV